MWRNWSRRKRWLVSLGAVLALAALVTAGALHRFLRIPKLTLPAGVSKRTEKLALTGKTVTVDFYLPPVSGPAPVVVIAHGFSRNRKTMAGWGDMLAREGFLVVVPDLPAWADHARNGRALAELLAQVQAGKVIRQPKPSGRAALVGFSAGGFSTLLAAAGSTNVSCWVGLDPVGLGRTATPGGGVACHPVFCAAGRTGAVEREWQRPAAFCGAAWAGLLAGGEECHSCGPGEPDQPRGGVGLRQE